MTTKTKILAITTCVAFTGLIGVHAEETEPVVNLIVDAGTTNVIDSGTGNNFKTISVAGSLVISNGVTVTITNETAASIAVPGGKIVVDGASSALTGYYASTHHKTTISQDANGRYGRITVSNGATYQSTPIEIAATTEPVTGLSEDGYIDFLTLKDGGIWSIRQMNNNSSHTGRVTVAGTGARITYPSGNSSTARFNKGAFVVDIQKGALFTFNVGNQKGYFNTTSASVVTMGEGDMSLLSTANDYDTDYPSSDCPLYVKAGAYFNHSGKLSVGRSGTGKRNSYILFQGTDALGPNLQGLYYDANGSVGGRVWIGLDEGVTLTTKNVDVSPSGSFFKAGTLKVGADFGTSVFAAHSFFTNATTAVEKIGSNEMTLNITSGCVTNGWMPTLKLSGGTVRIKSDIWLDTLDPKGGTFVVEDGKTLCIASGLAGFTGTINPPSGDMWDDGDHVICYYKGDDPNFTQWAVPLGSFQAASFKAEEIMDETSAYFGYKKVTLTVVEDVKEITILESGDCDLADTMSTMTEKMLVVTIAEGVDATNTTALTGNKALRVKGAGALTFAASSPGYAGYVNLQGIAQVYVTSDTPFGTGKVLLDEGSRKIVFANTESAITVPNDIEIESASAGVFTTITAAVKKVTFTGAITSPNGLSLSATYTDSNWKNKYVIFSLTGDVDVNAGTFYVSGYGFCEVHGPLVAEMAYASGGGSPEGAARIYLYDSANRIGTLQCRWAGKIYACGEEAFGGGVFTANTGKKFVFGVDGGSYDQHMQAFDGGVDSSQAIGTEASLTADSAAALTFTGGVATATAKRIAVKGALNLAVDAEGLTQTFAGGTWTTTGSVSVVKGTLVLKDYERYYEKVYSTNYINCASVPSLSVGSEGRLEFAGESDGVFAGAQTVTIDGGTLAFTGKGTLPFGPSKTTKTDIRINNGGKLEIAEGNVVGAEYVWVDGGTLMPGRYTGEGGPADAQVKPFLTGKGVLTVRKPTGMSIFVW